MGIKKLNIRKFLTGVLTICMVGPVGANAEGVQIEPITMSSSITRNIDNEGKTRPDDGLLEMTNRLTNNVDNATENILSGYLDCRNMDPFLRELLGLKVDDNIVRGHVMYNYSYDHFHDDVNNTVGDFYLFLIKYIGWEKMDEFSDLLCTDVSHSDCASYDTFQIDFDNGLSLIQEDKHISFFDDNPYNQGYISCKEIKINNGLTMRVFIGEINGEDIYFSDTSYNDNKKLTRYENDYFHSLWKYLWKYMKFDEPRVSHFSRANLTLERSGDDEMTFSNGWNRTSLDGRVRYLHK